MASAVTSQKLASQFALTMYDHDPGTTNAIVVTPDGGTTDRLVAMENYEYFGAGLMQTVIAGGGTGTTLFDLVVCSDSAGTNATTVVSSGAIQADAVGDFVWLEMTAAQAKEVADAGSFTPTHVGARVTSNNSGDEAVVVYVLAGPKYATKNLTATAISA